MRKLNALYINELAKVVHKPFYIIVVAIIVAAMFLTGVAGNMSVSGTYYYIEDQVISSSYFKDNLEFLRKDISFCDSNNENYASEITKTIEKLLDDNEYEDKIFVYSDSKVIDSLYQMSYEFSNYYYYTQQIAQYERYEKYEVNNISYLMECVDKISRNEAAKAFETRYEKLCEDYPLWAEAAKSNDFKNMVPAEIPDKTEDVSFYEEVLEQKDYKQYIEYQNKLVSENKSLSDEAKALAIKANELKLAINPDGTDNSQSIRERENAIDEYVKISTMAIEGVDSRGTILTPAEIEEYRAMSAELELAIKKAPVGFGAEKDDDRELFSQMMISVGMGIASLAVLLYAATTISDEIQSGSIKMLIITPVKRSKIFLAKLFAVMTVIASYGVIIFLSFILFNNIFGFGAAPVIFTAITGKVTSIGYYLYIFWDIVLDMLKLFVYASFAIMLSALLRNSALSICVTMFEYLAVSNVLPLIIASFDGVTVDVVKAVMPEASISLSEKIFMQNYPFVQSGAGALIELPKLPDTSFLFALIYTAVLLLVLFYIGFDSFCRRDIK